MQGKVIYRLATALWLSAITFLAFALSPVAFKLVGSDEIGVLLGWARRILWPAALAAGLIAGGALAWRASKGDRPHIRAKTALLAGALILTASGYWLSGTMEQHLATRVQAERVAFDRAHRESEGMIGTALLILLVIVGLG